MKSRRFASMLFAFAAFSLLSLNTLIPMHSYALTQPTDPVQISPVCATAADSTATWSAYNKNAFDVTFDWLNRDTGISGQYTAPASTTTNFKTDYQAGLNNQTEFTNEGSTSPVDRNSSNTECTPPVTPPVIPCVDGTNQANLQAVILSDDTYAVQTKNGGLLCDDVTVYVSSYVMPANFSGNASYVNGQFVDNTAYPQTKFASVSAVLSKGTTGLTSLSVNLPNRCNNIQTDLYYGPEITTVGMTGHGSQNILSNVLPSQASCQTGGMGGGPVVTPPVQTTPPAPSQPVQPVGGMGAGITTPVAAVVPANRLADTGSDSLPATILATLLIASALVIATRRKTTINSNS